MLELVTNDSPYVQFKLRAYRLAREWRPRESLKDAIPDGLESLSTAENASRFPLTRRARLSCTLTVYS